MQIERLNRSGLAGQATWREAFIRLVHQYESLGFKGELQRVDVGKAASFLFTGLVPWTSVEQRVTVAQTVRGDTSGTSSMRWLSPIKLLHIADTADRGGGETYLFKLANHLPRDHYTFSVLCPSEGLLPQRLRKIGIPVTPFEIPRLLSLAALMRLIR